MYLFIFYFFPPAVLLTGVRTGVIRSLAAFFLNFCFCETNTLNYLNLKREQHELVQHVNKHKCIM